MRKRNAITAVAAVAAATLAIFRPAVAAPQVGRTTDWDTWADRWTSSLKGDQTQVARAREELLKRVNPMSGTTSETRSELSLALVDRLGEVVDETDEAPWGGTVALLVASMLGTEQSLTMLERRLTAPHPTLRVHAAQGVARTIERDGADGRQPIIPERKILVAIRELARATARESDWWALKRQFDALASIRELGRLPRSTRDAAAEAMRDAADDLVVRLAATRDASELVRALDPVLTTMKQLQLASSGRGDRQMQRQMAGFLVSFLKMTETHWDSAHGKVHDVAYRRLIEIGENQLKVLGRVDFRDDSLADLSLAAAWEGGDRDAFRAQVDQAADAAGAW